MTDRRYELVLGPTAYDLVRADAAIPRPGPGEVLVRVHAVSINRRDLGIRNLSYPVNGANHFTPLSDGAGEIVAVGQDVVQWAPGDRVLSCFFQNWPEGRATPASASSALGAGRGGMLADHVLLSAQGVTRMPANWSFAEAACLPCAGVTAWSALMTLGRMQAGDWVLVLGTGGVAMFALQIAAAAGGRVIVLSSSDEKLARAKAMGAQAGINYTTTPDWAEAVRAATGGVGVAHAIELGGAGTVEKSLASLGLGGHLALIGALNGFGGKIDVVPMVLSALRASAVTVGSRADQLALTDFMVEHDLRPLIDSSFGIEQIEDAYARADKGAYGKVVVTLGA